MAARATSNVQRAANRAAGLSRMTSGAATRNRNRAIETFTSRAGMKATYNRMRRKSTGGAGG